ncbi:hypothetical protein [Leptospira levettii]|uniref:Uncharacterized protein n=1 Tax=Leptospira levettii TaxID=2023178 RepID=A0AAW5VGP7_9LEPT|nr:hypothetical protein [Leptospira levettii]MCW7467285.1 hypothetical protein [Leptospira levettii]MCW7513007.1 hypothetical protein [Leptospira levettii]MCW7516859.1 hypothetical protein [Leptospira levettii]
MENTKRRLSNEELMNLPKEDQQRLHKCLLPNTDEDTNLGVWVQNGVSDAHDFVSSSAGAINLLLGRK